MQQQSVLEPQKKMQLPFPGIDVLTGMGRIYPSTVESINKQNAPRNLAQDG